MKTKTSLLIFVAILLVSCTPAPMPIPTATTILAPTATNNSSPAKTSTPESTETITPVVIPDYMQEYLNRGFDTMSGNGILYVVIDEAKIYYAPEEGIIFHERVIRDWHEVIYIENGALKHGIVLDFVARGGTGPQSNFNKIMDSNGGSSGPFIPTLAFVRTIRESIISRTIGGYPIAKGSFGTGGDPNRELLFGDIFPDSVTTINIPGIGEVLTITQLDYVDKTPSP